MKKTILLSVAACFVACSIHANFGAGALGLKSELFPDENPSLNLPAGFNAKSTVVSSNRGGGVWEEGNMLFALGYGFPNFGKTLLKSTYIDETDAKITGFGPMHFRFEYALSETWGIGFSSNFNTYGIEYDYDDYNSLGQPVVYHWSEKITGINFLVRFNKHWAAGSKADIFSGTGLGYAYNKWTYKTDDPDYTNESWVFPIPVGFETTIGVRIFFTDNFAGYIEAGWAKSILQAGVCYKL